MEVAVSTVLAECFLSLQRGTCLETGGLPGFKPSRRTASQAAGGPHRRRNLWQPQANDDIPTKKATDLLGGRWLSCI